LIHIEQQWAENVKTTEGHNLHERVDDPFNSDKRGNILTFSAGC
jgi:CRISPR-associated exonuclease Cas4